MMFAIGYYGLVLRVSIMYMLFVLEDLNVCLLTARSLFGLLRLSLHKGGSVAASRD